MRTRSLGIIIGLTTALVSAPLYALERHQHNDVSFVTGGVGIDEQTAIRSLAGQFNLEVMTALKEGNYLAEIPVEIRDAEGNTLLALTMDGPYLLAQLDPGDYTVVAHYEGRSQSRTTRIDASRKERLEFYW